MRHSILIFFLLLFLATVRPVSAGGVDAQYNAVEVAAIMMAAQQGYSALQSIGHWCNAEGALFEGFVDTVNLLFWGKTKQPPKAKLCPGQKGSRTDNTDASFSPSPSPSPSKKTTMTSLNGACKLVLEPFKEDDPDPDVEEHPCCRCHRNAAARGEFYCTKCLYNIANGAALELTTDEGSPSAALPECENCGQVKDGKMCREQWRCHECQELICTVCFDDLKSQNIYHLPCGHMNLCRGCLDDQGGIRCPCQSGIRLIPVREDAENTLEESLKLGALVQFAKRQQQALQRCDYRVRLQDVVDFYCRNQYLMNEESLDSLKEHFADYHKPLPKDDDKKDDDGNGWFGCNIL